jgi:hypothetical protein
VKVAGVDTVIYVAETETTEAVQAVTGTPDTCRDPLDCGKQLAVGSADAVTRETAAKGANTDAVCAACTAGTWAATDGSDCVACTSIDGADATADAVTVTCTSASDTRFATGGCATATSKKTVGATGAMTTCKAACAAGTWDNSDVCTAITACAGNQLPVADACPVARLKTDATATADAVCDACAVGWAADGGNCVAHSVTCGKQADGTTRVVKSATSAGSCAACAAGSSAASDTADCVKAAAAGTTGTTTPSAAAAAASTTSTTPSGTDSMSAANTVTIGFGAIVIAAVAAVGL